MAFAGGKYDVEDSLDKLPISYNHKLSSPSAECIHLEAFATTRTKFSKMSEETPTKRNDDVSRSSGLRKANSFDLEIMQVVKVRANGDDNDPLQEVKTREKQAASIATIKIAAGVSEEKLRNTKQTRTPKDTSHKIFVGAGGEDEKQATMDDSSGFNILDVVRTRANNEKNTATTNSILRVSSRISESKQPGAYSGAPGEDFLRRNKISSAHVGIHVQPNADEGMLNKEKKDASEEELDPKSLFGDSSHTLSTMLSSEDGWDSKCSWASTNMFGDSGTCDGLSVAIPITAEVVETEEAREKRASIRSTVLHQEVHQQRQYYEQKLEALEAENEALHAKITTANTQATRKMEALEAETEALYAQIKTANIEATIFQQELQQQRNYYEAMTEQMAHMEKAHRANLYLAMASKDQELRQARHELDQLRRQLALSRRDNVELC